MADNPKEPYGHVTYADPGYKADKKKRYPLDSEAHCRAAWSYINMPKNHAGYTAEQVKAIKGRIKAALKRYGAEISEDERGSDDEALGVETSTRAPVEFRDARVDGVDFPQRTVTVIVTPYETPALVEYRGQLWHEIFERTAYDEVGKSPHRIRANRGHDRGRTVGKALHFYPERDEGCVSDVYIAKTSLGDETLALAADDCLSASAGFAVPAGGQKLDVRSKTRRITKAYMDHIAFVESPAYTEARVLAVRDDDPAPEFTPFPMTPNLDQFTNDDILRWASQRLHR